MLKKILVLVIQYLKVTLWFKWKRPIWQPRTTQYNPEQHGTTQNNTVQPGTERNKQDQQTGDFHHSTQIKNYTKEGGEEEGGGAGRKREGGIYHL